MKADKCNKFFKLFLTLKLLWSSSCSMLQQAYNCVFQHLLVWQTLPNFTITLVFAFHPNGTKYSRTENVKFVCSSRSYPFKFFKGCLRQILLGPFLNTLSQIYFYMIPNIKYAGVIKQNFISIYITWCPLFFLILDFRTLQDFLDVFKRI